MGVQKYAWTGKFNSTGTRGESESVWVIFAPMANEDIKQVASLYTDHYYENNTDNTYLKTEGNVTTVDDKVMSGGFYPIKAVISQESGRYDSIIRLKIV